ncbi:ADP-ribosylation factor(Arf)/Arf-like (Arl) small GTPase family protein (macronuclear) [Tetrahymena thermophila SB210]|uniref:ADP-ribosylation factor(Arf)/Arf-like (Arl) small GTPase family protein n=2 Tax=Tetrahymena thermophila TaxID=5911 RepID=I7LTW8_TETTS|nr:ADP-ribosylation factor(Arf)/Arf-like (Arl) small GTPase family protein [Tetrahymena thermophila SB210]EAR87432.2 ADP-ribosylation factor(Arf)/Arf-like (Arl) small GTPase family protein [Tetrahymena thermophila SB210]BAJ21338.1 Rab-family small GTPase RabX25 [Tetrahymena thermophila]|eukprot:XP_001007677.2 ADP-ribosylation factor(Arf)/Arf-like (Arl) small GTPase family protein [Tetrahymena thermophila SB210]
MDTQQDEDQQINESMQSDNIEVIEYPFQVVLIGDPGVGKTSFLIRFSEDQFLKNVNTSVGIDFRFRSLILQNKQIKLKIWDTAGQENFRSISKKYFQKADAVVIMFDITNNESFNNLGYWSKELNENCKDINIPKILVGHKSDLNSKRTVLEEEIDDFVSSQNMEYIEASAKENTNVIMTFAKIGQKLIDIYEDGELNFQKNNREMLITQEKKKIQSEAHCKCCLNE